MNVPLPAISAPERAMPGVDPELCLTGDDSIASRMTLLMIRVKDHRDSRAFSDLFDHFAPRLKGFVMRSGAPGHQAEEVVQDVMLTVWRKADSYDPKRAHVAAWVYQIARNRHVDLLRKEARPVPEALRNDDTELPDASHLVTLDQESSALKKALQALPEGQREIIEKAYMGDMTHQEISSETRLPLGTIKSRIRLALTRLRDELKDLHP